VLLTPRPPPLSQAAYMLGGLQLRALLRDARRERQPSPRGTGAHPVSNRPL